MKKILSSLFLLISLSASADIEVSTFPVYMEDITVVYCDGKYYAFYKDMNAISISKPLYDAYMECKKEGCNIAMYGKITYYPGYECLNLYID